MYNPECNICYGAGTYELNWGSGERDDCPDCVPYSANVFRDNLLAIRGLHSLTYGSVDDEVWVRNPRCAECQKSYPCETRRLADVGLGF